MKIIKDQFFEGERPLFASRDIRLENVRFYPGESAMKESRNVEAFGCQFMGKYPFWHNDNATIENCLFTVYSRAAIWYSKNIKMIDTMVEAPKMFRQVQHLHLENTKLPNAAECCWNCDSVKFRNVDIKGGDYLLMNSKHIDIDGFRLQGDYSFQDARNVVVRNAMLDSKDAFWNTDNVTVYNSILMGEYLGWHSKNLRLVNCTIHGTQPLCYNTDLVMENCKMVDTDLCFEYSTVHAEIDGDIKSIKNPRGGSISAKGIGEIIIDENCINSNVCQITTGNEVMC